jgi:hypothetical protein
VLEALPTRYWLHEKIEQQRIVQLATSVQGTVYVLGTRRGKVKCQTCGTLVMEYQGTKQTAGISDLVIIMPKARYLSAAGTAIDEDGAEYDRGQHFGPCLLFFEAKSPERAKLKNSGMSTEQCEFRDLIVALGIEGVEHCVGTYDAFIAWCCAHGYCRVDAFPHYRQPKAVNA